MNTKQLENWVIESMRATLTHLGRSRVLVSMHLQEAQDVFGFYQEQWSEEFLTLYNQMLEIYRASTPRQVRQRYTTHIEVGYTSFPVKEWVADKIQPVPPTANELVARFDHVVIVYTNKRKESKE